MSNESKRIRDLARINLPGALDSVIELELFNTVDELCRNAEPWGETLEITLQPGTVVYNLTPANQVIVAVYLATHATMDLTDSLYDPETGELSILNTPTTADIAAGPMFIDVTLTPALAATVDNLLPSRLWVRHHQTILEGLLGRMMSQVAKPYSNEKLGTYHLKRFRNFTALARANAIAGAVPNAQAWSFPGWA